MSPFLYILGGVAYGVLLMLVAPAIGKAIKAGGLRVPAVDETPDAGIGVLVDEPENGPADELADVPAEVLSDAEVDARFRQMIRPEFTWESWL